MIENPAFSLNVPSFIGKCRQRQWIFSTFVILFLEFNRLIAVTFSCIQCNIYMGMKAIKIFTAILLNRLNKPTKVPCKKNAKLIHWDIHVNTISIQFNKYCLNCLKIRHKYKKMVYFQPTSCTCTCSLKTK